MTRQGPGLEASVGQLPGARWRIRGRQPERAGRRKGEEDEMTWGSDHGGTS